MTKTNIIHSKIVYKGKFVNVRMDTVLTNGKKVTNEIIESKEGVIIAFLSEDNKLLLINQYRHKLGNIFELPAGAIKEGETPLQAAKRELREETGFQAKEWKLISSHRNGVHQEGLNYYFLARKQLINIPQELDSDEKINHIKLYTFKQIDILIRKGLIPCLRSKACIWLTELILTKNKLDK